MNRWLNEETINELAINRHRREGRIPLGSTHVSDGVKFFALGFASAIFLVLWCI